MAIEITMMARYAGKCIACNQRIDEGELIKFNTFKKTAKHVKCSSKELNKKGYI